MRCHLLKHLIEVVTGTGTCDVPATQLGTDSNQLSSKKQPPEIASVSPQYPPWGETSCNGTKKLHYRIINPAFACLTWGMLFCRKHQEWSLEGAGTAHD